jgi:hypothetical protein
MHAPRSALLTHGRDSQSWGLRLFHLFRGPVQSDRFLQAAGHSLSHRREEVAAVVISTPESVVPMPALGGAYANYVTPGLDSKASKVTGQDVAELGNQTSQ